MHYLSGGFLCNRRGLVLDACASSGLENAFAGCKGESKARRDVGKAVTIKFENRKFERKSGPPLGEEQASQKESGHMQLD